MNNNTVIIKLDKTRTVKLSNKALKRIEQSLNCPIMDLVAKLQSLSINDMVLIVYEGLVHEDSTLTLEAVEDLLDEHCTFVGLLKVTTEAFTVALGKPEELGVAPNAPRTVGKK